ncbi:MAG: hypothetical protein JWO38_6993 [Gemmataceae bacterium]|nr:hypothetical protein [Gemmataceae bacterium]
MTSRKDVRPAGVPRRVAVGLFAALAALSWGVGTVRGQQPGAVLPPLPPAVSDGAGPTNPAPPPTPPGPQAGGDKKSAAPDKAAPDPAAQARSAAGQAAFQSKCTTCHDADRSLSKTKSLPDWQATVRRMAAKPGADIGSGEGNDIAAYLAGRGSAGQVGKDDKGGAGGSGKGDGGSDPPSFSVFATISPLWRGGSSEIQNPGFFPEAFIGGSWQGKGALSARATVCTSCHGHGEPGFVNRIDLLEAVVRFDIADYLGPDVCRGMRAAAEAGRFIVPFGAFSAQVNPGVYRTVSKPLIFNMGQRARFGDVGDTVLPMPFAHEGVLLSLAAPLLDLGAPGKLTGTLDLYGINGLSGGADGIDFDRSRDLLSNNGVPGWGGRATVGTPFLRAGASITGGQFNDLPAPGPSFDPMRYLIYGFDVTARYKDLIRVQAEYARRDNDRFDTGSGLMVRESVRGVYVEGEVRFKEGSPVSFLARYDWMDRTSPLPIPGGTLPTGSFDIRRWTLGVNVALLGRSLLMLDYERWLFQAGLDPVTVWGARYAVTF